MQGVGHEGGSGVPGYPQWCPLIHIPLNAHLGHRGLCRLVGQRVAQHVWIWHSLKSAPVCRSSVGAAELRQLIERQAGLYTLWNTKRSKLTSSHIHMHTQRETIVCSASHCGRHTFNQRKLDCCLCLCMQCLYGPVIRLYHTVSHIALYHVGALYHIMSYHVTVSHCLAFNCIIFALFFVASHCFVSILPLQTHDIVVLYVAA